MDYRGLLRSETLAWAIGALFVFVAAIFAFAFVGWLGVGLLGMAGLLVTTRLELHDGLAVADSDHGSSAAPLFARQLDEAGSHASPEAKMAAEAEKTERLWMLYAVNTVFIAMIVLGIGLFLLRVW